MTRRQLRALVHLKRHAFAIVYVLGATGMCLGYTAHAMDPQSPFRIEAPQCN
jgi:hypothetical protein